MLPFLDFLARFYVMRNTRRFSFLCLSVCLSVYYIPSRSPVATSLPNSLSPGR